MAKGAGGGRDMNTILSDVLKYGMVASTTLIVAGIILALVRPEVALPTSLGQLVSTTYGMPTLDPAKLFAGVATADPSSVLQLGLLVLLATPLARVIASTVIFASEKDSTYVVITLVVLTILMVGIFVVGPFESASG
jgi:uncharacterized membrane protein